MNKKISQNELRKLMSAQKRKALDSIKKIESPLAKYSDAGVLTCIICESVVRSEAVWNVHINSKQHKENILLKIPKKPPETSPPAPQPEPEQHVFKKPSALEIVEDEPPPKKLKSILKNAPAAPLPPGFFDEKTEEENVIEEAEDEKMETEEPPPPELPEGFFDNPVLDAKARNVEYKDPIQEEWERFQKEIKEETSLSAQIIQDETEDSTATRQIEEIDEQLRKLSRVVDLEKKKEKFKAESLLKPKEIKEENMSDDDDDDYEVEFDWRAKRYLC